MALCAKYSVMFYGKEKILTSFYDFDKYKIMAFLFSFYKQGALLDYYYNVISQLI